MSIPDPLRDAVPYRPRRTASSHFITVRGLAHHLLQWGTPDLQHADRPTLVLTHGWMDVGASFQFVVDAMADDRHIVALDWRGFGRSATPASDTYWFNDYVGDLDGLLDALQAQAWAGPQVDLLGHSMGGNVVMVYAGVRPARVRRLVNLEGFGMAATQPHQAPDRIALWLKELKSKQGMFSYGSPDAVAFRLMKNNPRLPPDKALWLATQWAEARDDDRWHILADPGHKRIQPLLYQQNEVVACWERIRAPLLWVEGRGTALNLRYNAEHTREAFDARMDRVPQIERLMLEDAGHMLHHDQPERLAAALQGFLNRP